MYCIVHVLYCPCTVLSMYCIVHVLYCSCTVLSMYCIVHVLYCPCTVLSMYCIVHVLYCPCTVLSMYCIVLFILCFLYKPQDYTVHVYTDYPCPPPPPPPTPQNVLLKKMETLSPKSKSSGGEHPSVSLKEMIGSVTGSPNYLRLYESLSAAYTNYQVHVNNIY